MPVPVLAVAGSVAAIIAIVVCLQVLERRRLAQRHEVFTREAAQRGWQYACSAARGTRTERFQGMGLAGPWTAEVIEHRGRKRPGVRLLRWWNSGPDSLPLAAGAVVLLVSTDAGQRLPDPELGDGVLARMAARAVQMAVSFAVTFRFGAIVPGESREWRLVQTPQPILQGFAVLSDRPDDAVRRLTPGLVDALRRAFPPGAWDTRRARQPWLALVGDRVAIACMSVAMPHAADVAALADAGGIVAGARG